jgi:hypothetical protein
MHSKGAGIFTPWIQAWICTCGVHCVESILAGKEMWRKELEIGEMLREVDRFVGIIIIRRCREKAPLIVRIEEVVGWQRLWVWIS